MAKGELYRGYVVWTYDGEERVDRIRPAHSPAHSDVWQSRQRLEERLRECLVELRSKVTHERDLKAHVETINTDILNGDGDDE
jgi:hypothetical protein